MGWPAFVLPFVEATALYQSIDLDRGSYVTTNNDAWLYGAANVNQPRGEVFHRVPSESAPPVFRCPSTAPANIPGSQKDYAVPMTATIEHSDETGASWPSADFAATTVNNQRGLGAITGGTSNTFMFLEHANRALRHDSGLGYNPFLWVGHWGQGVHVWGTPPNRVPASASDDRGRYRSAKSFHVGGINTAIYDGSVQYVSETVDLHNTFDSIIRRDMGILGTRPF